MQNMRQTSSLSSSQVHGISRKRPSFRWSQQQQNQQHSHNNNYNYNNAWVCTRNYSNNSIAAAAAASSPSSSSSFSSSSSSTSTAFTTSQSAAFPLAAARRSSSYNNNNYASLASSQLVVPRAVMEPRKLSQTERKSIDDALQLGSGYEVEHAAMLKTIQTTTGSGKFLSGYTDEVLDEAYERCRVITAEYAKTFYLGTKLMSDEKRRATWAIYVWCRRTDELVDGPNASRITPMALQRWEDRLRACFDGRPFDVLDAALADTVARFPLEVQPFVDMVDGMRMDLIKQRYQTFDELYEYCYRVAGTVGLMTTPVMGIHPDFKGDVEAVYEGALALGTANQLTNILRDVGEDLRERNRIYVPLDELNQFGITESDLVNYKIRDPITGKVDDRWRSFMKFQIARAREYFTRAESAARCLDPSAAWPVWSALVIYRGILDAIEENDYDNLSQRAYVSKMQKFAMLPQTYIESKQFKPVL